MNQFKTKKIKAGSWKKSQQIKKIAQKKSPPQSKKILRRIAGGILIFALIIFWAHLWLQAIGNQHFSKNDEYKLFNPIRIDFWWEENTGPKGIKNILLAGIWWAWHNGSSLTDSLMLASIDFDSKSVTLLSIPRDLYVAYSKNTAGRINALYAIWKQRKEGINLLAKKVHEITGQPIDHYAVIDFQWFKSIIDTLGGITIDVPKTIRDTTYPTYNYGYTTFYIEKGRQTLNWERALRYARSRHSTSDYDRSARQQLILRAIKEKAMTLGILVQPQKITQIFDSLQTHINTDLTIGDVTNMALAFKNIDKKNIYLYTLNSNCAYLKCRTGAYLYNPHRSYFGGAAAVIPEKAAPSRLSQYDDIKRFSELIFKYPTISKEPRWIQVISTKSQKSRALLIRKGLEQLGFALDHKKAILFTETPTDTSLIKVYTGTDGSGNTLDKESITVKALGSIEPNMPIEYIQDSTHTGAKIEIILWKDFKNYFDFAKPIQYYLNDISPKTNSGKTKWNEKSDRKKKIKSNSSKSAVSSGEAKRKWNQTRKNLIEWAS